MVKVKFLIPEPSVEGGFQVVDSKIGIQPQFVSELMAFLSLGIHFDGKMWYPTMPFFDVEQEGLLVPLTEQAATVAADEPEPGQGFTITNVGPDLGEDFFQQTELLFDEQEEIDPENLSPEDRRKLFRLISKTREEEDE
jgi:hypothetical protein